MFPQRLSRMENGAEVGFQNIPCSHKNIVWKKMGYSRVFLIGYMDCDRDNCISLDHLSESLFSPTKEIQSPFPTLISPLPQYRITQCCQCPACLPITSRWLKFSPFSSLPSSMPDQGLCSSWALFNSATVSVQAIWPSEGVVRMVTSLTQASWAPGGLTGVMVLA